MSKSIGVRWGFSNPIGTRESKIGKERKPTQRPVLERFCGKMRVLRTFEEPC